MKKLKIAHLICDLGPGGGQKSTIDLINTTNGDFENHLILLENIREYEPDGVDLSYVCQNKNPYKKLNRFGDWLLSKKLDKILKEKDIDIIISHMEVTAKVLYFINVPKIFYMRVDITQELDDLKSKNTLRYQKRKSLYTKIFSNQNLITISKDTEKNICNFIKPKKIETIYNAFDFEKINNLANQNIDNEIDSKYIIQIGSGFKRKGQDTLLKAFSKVKNKDIKLLLLGTNMYYELEKLIKDLSLESRVVLRPFTTNPYPWIKDARLLVMSSIREGLPRVIVESLSLKTPVISTDCDTGPREILVDDLKIYLSEVGNSDQMAKNIDRALENYPKIDDGFIEKFDKNIIRKKYVNYINKVFNESTDK